MPFNVSINFANQQIYRLITSSSMRKKRFLQMPGQRGRICLSCIQYMREIISAHLFAREYKNLLYRHNTSIQV